MTQLITAVYEKGMFKPPKEVNLKEHAEVKLIIKQENSAKDAFRKNIGELKKSMSDKLFLDDLKEISNDFKDVDSEEW